MKPYTEVTFNATREQSDILIALLSEIGFEMFDDSGETLAAYISTDDYSEPLLTQTLKHHGLSLDFQAIHIAPQNWNTEWEKHFPPVDVEGKVFIRAPFHQEPEGYKYIVEIEPKMSFGTGHHASTYLMTEMILEEDFSGKKVLDFGCGTGVLAILAEMAGASDVLAIDIEEWAVENAMENAQRNGCNRIKVVHGTEASIHNHYDIILANINRHVLLATMQILAIHLKHNGALIVGGILNEDRDVIQGAATAFGLVATKSKSKDNWLSIHFIRSS